MPVLHSLRLKRPSSPKKILNSHYHHSTVLFSLRLKRYSSQLKVKANTLPILYPCLIRRPVITASRPTILILTTHTGGGHLNLAQALKGILEARYNVAIVNPQPALVDSFYSTVSRHCLKFLAWQYTWTDTKIASLWLQRTATLFDSKRI